MKNSAKLVSKIDEVLKKIDRSSKKRMQEALDHNEKAVRGKLRGQGSGRLYQHPSGGTYRASRPGSPPAERTGALLGGMQTAIAQEKGNLVGKVGNTHFSAFWLEFGTVTMAPRPFLSNTLQEEARTTMRILSRRWF